MSPVAGPGHPKPSFISGRQFADQPGPNIPMIAGYAFLAGTVAPDVVEQSADLIGAYMRSLSFGPSPDAPDFFVPKAMAFVAGLSGAALHTTFALLAARRQAIAPPVVHSQAQGTSE